MPRCCWYHRPSALGSLARKKNPPMPVTFSVSVASALPSRTAAPAGEGEAFGCAGVCAAKPSWFRLQNKLEPKATDSVRSIWRLCDCIQSSVQVRNDWNLQYVRGRVSVKRKNVLWVWEVKTTKPRGK